MCMAAIQILESLPDQERLSLGYLLAKRSHSHAGKIMGESLDGVEMVYLRKFDSDRIHRKRLIADPSWMLRHTRANGRLLKSWFERRLSQCLGPSARQSRADCGSTTHQLAS